MGRTRVPFITLGVVATLALMAGAQALADSSDPFEPPPEGTLTVSPAPPGEDYKSNPAEPEAPVVFDHPLTVEELQKEVDPDDSPWIRLCVNEDGSGQIEFITPADPDAKVDPDMAKGPFATAEPLIKNDKGACE